MSGIADNREGAENREGVTRFTVEHQTSALDLGRHAPLAARLLAWREILGGLGLVGQKPDRYDGAAYGNVSARVGPPGAGRGARAFLVTGTQTSGLRCAGPNELCVVERYDPTRNRVVSHGPIQPSSESMTHGAFYDQGAHLRFVFHVHAPVLWTAAATLRLPTTPVGVDYGTPEMARSVADLWRSGGLAETQILAMASHQDGIVVCGRSAEEAAAVLLKYLSRAYEVVCAERGQICRDP